MSLILLISRQKVVILHSEINKSNRMENSTIQFTKMHGAGNDYIYVNTLIYNIKNPAKAQTQIFQCVYLIMTALKQ